VTLVLPDFVRGRLLPRAALGAGSLPSFWLGMVGGRVAKNSPRFRVVGQSADRRVSLRDGLAGQAGATQLICQVRKPTCVIASTT
jgi:hypothetical protein